MSEKESHQHLSSENNSSNPSGEQEAEITLTSLVCDTCFGDNLYRSIGIRSCLRCKQAFCLHFCSKADPCHFCVNCFSDLSVSISDPEVQVIEHYNPATNKTTRYERHPRGRRIKLGGEGYLFALRIFQDMNDAEQDMFVEFYRAILGFLLSEQEAKRAEKAHKAAGVKQHGGEVKLGTAVGTPAPIKTTVTNINKTTVSKQNKAREQAKAALFAMYKGKLSMEQIDQMLNAQVQGKN